MNNNLPEITSILVHVREFRLRATLVKDVILSSDLLIARTYSHLTLHLDIRLLFQLLLFHVKIGCTVIYLLDAPLQAIIDSKMVVKYNYPPYISGPDDIRNSWESRREANLMTLRRFTGRLSRFLPTKVSTTWSGRK